MIYKITTNAANATLKTIIMIITAKSYCFFLIGIVLAFTSSACKSIGKQIFPIPESCYVNQLAESRSNDGKWKAVVFYQDCSEIRRDISTNVSILPENEPLPDEDLAGNVFSVSESDGTGYPRENKKNKINIYWQDDDRLIIDYDESEKSRVRKADESFSNIKISYQ